MGILLALAYRSVTEWIMHKHLLHYEGRKKSSFWNFHWQHHKNCRKNNFRDPDYEKGIGDFLSTGKLNTLEKEALLLAAVAMLHLPLLPIAPGFTMTYLLCLVDYFDKHTKSHRDPEWGKKHLPWHYDHHMGRNQDANWGVTQPWFDYLMGTRVKYQIEKGDQKLPLGGQP